MENKLGMTIRFRNNGKKYIAEFISENFVSEKAPTSLIKGIAMFRIYDEQQKNVLGCVSFTESMLLGFVWAQPDKKHFPVQYKIEALVNLLHYFPFDPSKFRNKYPSCYEYRFERNLQQDREEDGLYLIKTEDSFEATFQSIMFDDEVTNRKIQEAALEVLFNNWEDNPDTNVSVELLEAIIPVSGVNINKNLKLLLNEKKIHAVTEPSNLQKLISVGLEPSTIRELEGETKSEVKYASMVKNVFGTNIENTTYGASSSITVNIEEIETVFEALQKEINENPELKNKVALSKTVKELETEITTRKNPNKVKELLEKVKGSGQWIYNKIISNPIISGIIVDLLMKAV